MTVNLNHQAFALLTALALGLGLGLAYDILRPPRRRGGRLLTALLDVLFGLLSAAAAFVYAMGAGEGRLGFWELTAFCLGFLLYMQLLSPLFLPPLTAVVEFLYKIIVWCKKNCVKFLNSAKKNFQKVRKCFIVKR